MVPFRVQRLMRRLNSPQDTNMAIAVACALLFAEAVLSALIIWRIPYTEIDWEAYMDQVEGFLEGERDYRALKGPTGPLVYPAGFLYIYSGLYWLSGRGQVFPAQVAFAAMYLATQAVVLGLYIRSKAVPPWVLCLLCLSKRLHSIYLLRLFNDGVAMLLAYVATWLLLSHRWRASLVAFSAAVSVKMNVLLMAPPVLLICLKGATLTEVVQGAAAGVALQLVLGAPFLAYDAAAYLSRSFELSRVFFHVWSVNLKFLPEDVFQSKGLALALLAAHLALLWLFAQNRWCRREGGVGAVVQDFWQRSLRQGKQRVAAQKLRPDHILLVLFSGNFIGILCARTLHFQFYSWYFHTLPFLLWQVELHSIVRVGLWLVIELIWNMFPSTAVSSLSLMACHLGILLALRYQPVKQPSEKARGSPSVPHASSRTIRMANLSMTPERKCRRKRFTEKHLGLRAHFYHFLPTTKTLESPSE